MFMDTASHTSDYDAFGDPAAPVRPRSSVTRRARNMAVAVFWSVALVLIAGRVYQHNLAAASHQHPMDMASR